LCLVESVDFGDKIGHRIIKSQTNLFCQMLQKS
jgi:hypothetical protein